jgi:lipopolysaccharide biosynthesis regulator YciM
MTSPSAAPTATLAELYLRQGLLGRARAIYQKLAAGPDPAAAEAARRRLSELGPSAAGRIAALEGLLEQVQRRRAQRAHVTEG